jgi:hypothetical protein
MNDKFIVKFFRSGNLAESSVFAHTIVQAEDSNKALAIARHLLMPKYPEVAHWKLWSVNPYPE